MAIVRVIKAYENEIVEIWWYRRGSTTPYYERHTIPPKPTTEARTKKEEDAETK